jgi:hypothetical protein
MRMIDNEDSVVTSLNELRKLKHERMSRQTQSRSTVSSASAARAVALAEDPASEQLTPPPVQPLSIVSSHAQPFAGNAGFGMQTNPNAGFAKGQMIYEHAPMQATTIVKTKTSYKAAVAVAVVLMGAGAAGYMKLQGDMQSTLAASKVSVSEAEEARNKAVEAAARADQQSKANLRQCEDKLKASMAAAVAPVAPAAPAAAPAAPAEKPEKPAPAAKMARSSSHTKAAAKPARHVAERAPRPAASPKQAAKSSDIPTIAKKKKLDNDPLAGLGKL